MSEKGWSVKNVVPNEVHVVPHNDLIEHTPDECTCGPTLEPIKRDDGSYAWLLIHHSIDGREKSE